MPWPVTINGRTYQQSDFSPYGYAASLPNLAQDMAAVGDAANAIVSAGTYGNSGRQRLINGNFAINQRGVASASTSFAAGVYTRDRWKAGAGGATVSWSDAASGDASPTITAGTLQQVIEGALYLQEGGTYVLSWTGTAQARVNGGAYAASPIAVTGLAAGANATIEFGTGTVGLVQFEPGTKRTVYERRDDEMRRAQRYYHRMTNLSADYFYNLYAAANSQLLGITVTFPVTMRATPTVVYSASNSGSFNSNNPNLDDVNVWRARIRGDGTGYTILQTFAASAEL